MSLVDLWSAGFETTVTTLEWALLYMAVEPQVQAKVAAEIDATLGAERRVTMADRLKMPYTLATIAEVQRLGNIVPLNLQHATKTDVTIGGQLIPAGTAVIPQLSAVHLSEKHFAQAHQFRPQRFIDDPKLVEKVSERLPVSDPRS